MRVKKLVVVALLGMILLLSPVVQASSDIETRLNDLEKRIETLETRFDELASLIELSLLQTETRAKIETTKIQTQMQKSVSAPERIEGEIAIKITVKSDQHWKYAWKLTFKNNRKEPVLLTAKIQFQDKDGFVIDDDSVYDLSVDANEEKAFSDYLYINLPEAKEVARVYVKVEVRKELKIITFK